ncbi:MAG: FecR family protein [Gammaproteobacteria bacterium]|nr:FecR family protein [Gammaproteobacteria bacterium]
MKIRRALIIAILLLAQALPAWAVKESGQVLFVAGSVTAQREEVVVLKKEDPVYEKDEIATAGRSRGQLLMQDGAKIALRPDTIFRIEEYFQVGDELEQPDGSVIVATQDSAVTELIKGGFRTITGAIGQNDPDAYVVETPAATLGIRGTHYSIVWCSSDCGPPPGVTVARAILDGLYVGVTDGVVFFVNNTGEYLMRAGEFVYVADRDTTPVSLPVTPDVLIDTYPSDLADEEEAAQEVAETIAALGSEEAAKVGLSSAESVAAAGTATGAGAGTGTDSGTGTDTGTGTDSGAGTDTGTGTGSGTGPGGGTDTGADPGGGTDTGADTGGDADTDADTGDDTDTGTTGGFSARSEVPLPDPPLETGFGDSPHDSSTGGFDSEPETPIQTDTGTPITDGQPPFTRGVALGSGPISGVSTNAFTASSASGTRTFSGNDLTAFQAPLPGGDTDSTYAIGTAGIRDDGFDPVTGFGWGRWSGGTATVTSGSSPSNVDLSEQSLHWLYGPQLSSAPSVPMTGTANFSLITGNTDPTDTLGNSGRLGDASLTANFTTATVQSELSLSIAGSIWEASGNGSIASGLFNGLYNSVSVGGSPGGNGSFSGFFGPPGSNSLPNGAGLTYGLNDTQGVSVSGAVVFGQPTP